MLLYKKLGQNDLERKQAIAGYLFILPNLIGFFIFVFVPLIASFILSFFSWDLVNEPTYVGLENFKMMFSRPLFCKTLLNTIYYTFGVVPLTIILGLFLAVLVNNTKKNFVYKFSFFMPYLIPMVGAALIWQSIYMPNFGILVYLLDKIGINSPQWLSDPNWAMPAIIIMSVWKSIGFTFIVLLAGLQGIPARYYEAARIDGASPIQQFFKITVPLLTPTIFFAVVISMIDSFKVFDQAFILTKGGPADATKTLVYYIYTQGFEYFRMGYASSIGWFLLIIIFTITVFQFIYQRKWVSYDL
ncbi:carbohydrate ABC transporter permease [Halanaerobium salsuginis]|uniref:Multiple sugar transport system permease protein n=1 Tax=Halanaerobium salsuginis TaxID=29563 RepID=A0A1I4GNY9_9FIRM|nr:sugar ABC transporter permease [Halanaerobium salsuginis]SFL31792.1 multiple sugar transport system permease protein [Halanaerobium salsuginis]